MLDQISEPLPNLQPERLVESYSLLKDKQSVELFYEKDVLELIVVESSRYTAQNDAHNFNQIKEELKVFLAMFILSGYHTLHRQALYWCRDEDVSEPLIHQKLAGNCFRASKQYLQIMPLLTRIIVQQKFSSICIFVNIFFLSMVCSKKI